MGDRENKFQKIQISQNEILRMKFTRFFSIPVKFEIFFFGLQITNYIYNP